MAKADLEFIVDIRQAGVQDDLIPALDLTAFYESGLEIEAKNPVISRIYGFVSNKCI